MVSPGPSEPGRRLHIAAVWGVLGVIAIFARALWSLTPLALEPIRNHSLTAFQVVLYVLWVLFMAYSEGYKSFHQQMAPRVAARSMYLATYPRPLWVLLAPFFCIGLFHATRRRMIVSWSVLIGIVGLVIAVRQLDQPWRGMIDGGVVVGLGWGVAAMVWNFYKSLTGRLDEVSPEVPAGSS